MPFRKTFERRVNEEMQENAEAGPAPRPESMDPYPNSKKSIPPSTPDMEAEDIEWSEKKDQPPRFSTLFGVTPPPAPREPENLPVPPRRQPTRGVTLSTPIFVGIVVILLFESTLLFAYTVIGLYKNIPSGIIPGMGAPAGCRCNEDSRPAINIAPNFMIPQSQSEATETITVTTSPSPPPPESTTTSKPTSTSTSTSTSTTSSDSASQAAALVASMLGQLSTSTSSPSPTTTPSTTSSSRTKSTTIITETPSQSTVRSTKLVTVNAEGSTLPSSPRSTVTSTKLVGPSSTAA
ncbi:hypothetical protein KC332_g7078 [Hortaea werneckii]|uniref:Uncharacterized protein n=2 Tax=Hortaea werneckii TaxID=91943 RepID=A0A3M7IHH3_HORWE|nr:hypothetical protein KC358_g6709 [Hortaea werneckii]OTA30355.1 hypothetical protein BTJ68_09304 [Hortaea werneckii EXF-2000]KAI6836442.1 hypothetical protein KC350_g6298 [Hortaea werneckii]KAI6931439.1 hypothetical protein KC348_g7256 [Hortaea werneckii]KAI6936032.1 hypothetical protein KC341_g6495 [Hortaea werneckii]